MKKFAFIGAGSMAEAIISGIIDKGMDPACIWAGNRSDRDRLSRLEKEYGINGASSLEELLAGAATVVLAVKPKDVLTVLQAARPYITENMLILSVAAGVSTASLEAILQAEIPIIRAMPNTSAAVGQSATALTGNRYADSHHLAAALELFQAIGTVSLVSEDMLDSVTGLSGSGPAYIYYLVEAMEKAASSLTLDEKAAKQLIIQTLIGAADMLKQSPKTPAELRREVTSPGGTTEAGIRVLESFRVQEAFTACIQEAARQSERMGAEISSRIEAGLSRK